MIALINILAALATIGFGAFGMLAPRYTMEALEMQPAQGSAMGLSEIRASTGGLFVAMGLAVLVIGAPLGYAMLGFAYLGAATGRLMSVVSDAPPRKALWFFVVEAVLAAWLILANM